MSQYRGSPEQREVPADFLRRCAFARPRHVRLCLDRAWHRCTCRLSLDRTCHRRVCRRCFRCASHWRVSSHNSATWLDLARVVIRLSGRLASRLSLLAWRRWRRRWWRLWRLSSGRARIARGLRVSSSGDPSRAPGQQPHTSPPVRVGVEIAAGCTRLLCSSGREPGHVRRLDGACLQHRVAQCASGASAVRLAHSDDGSQHIDVEGVVVERARPLRDLHEQHALVRVVHLRPVVGRLHPLGQSLLVDEAVHWAPPKARALLLSITVDGAVAVPVP